MVLKTLKQIRKMGLRKAARRGLAKYGYWLLLKYPGLIPYPKLLMIEPTNICNLKCPLCANKYIKNKGMMSFENFKIIIDKLPFIEDVVLFLFGESLLNRNFFKMVKYCHGKGMKTTVDTNGTVLHKFDFDEIFSSGLDSIGFSLDGATKEVYEKYRVGGDFDRVVKNIRNLCAEKHKRGLKKPIVSLQFIVFKHNECQIPDIINLAEELQVDYLDLKATHLGDLVTPDEKKKLAKEWLPKYKLKRFNEDLNLKYVTNVCPAAFDYISIAWNGDMVACCEDFKNDFVVGNILEQPFDEIFRSRKYTELRKKIIKREIYICKCCDITSEQDEVIPIYEEHR
jgi:radical SAM protein with 4Fe4S-binding SPASM domain